MTAPPSSSLGWSHHPQLIPMTTLHPLLPTPAQWSLGLNFSSLKLFYSQCPLRQRSAEWQTWVCLMDWRLSPQPALRLIMPCDQVTHPWDVSRSGLYNFWGRYTKYFEAQTEHFFLGRVGKKQQNNQGTFQLPCQSGLPAQCRGREYISTSCKSLSSWGLLAVASEPKFPI